MSLIYKFFNITHMSFFFLLSISVCSNAQSNQLTAKQILSGYEQSLSVLKDKISFNATTETTFEGAYNYDLKSKNKTTTVRVCRDDKKLGISSIITDFSENIDSPKSQIAFKAVSTDEAMFCVTPIDQPIKSITMHNDTNKYSFKMLGQLSQGITLDGYLPGNKDLSFPEIMKAEDVILREDTEIIDGHETYVLEAKTPYGQHTVWIDPECGFNPRRIVVTKSGNDLSDDKPISTPPSFRKLFFPHHPKSPISKRETVVDSIKIEKIGDVFIPTKADIVTSTLYENGQKTYDISTHKRSDFNFNPDFDAMNAFDLEIPNGTLISFQDERGKNGIRYEWFDGKPRAIVDKETLQALDNEIKLLKNNSKTLPDIAISDLLAKYRETQDKLQAFFAKSETSIKHINTNKQSTNIETTSEFKYDGNRVSYRLSSKNEVIPYTSYLWDGEYFIKFKQSGKKNKGQAYIKKDDTYKSTIIANEYHGAPLMGFYNGNTKRIDYILDEADNISLRDTTEQINKSSCYVVDATIKEKQYTLWIDPQNSYNIAQLKIIKGTTEDDPIFSIKNVQFENFDDISVPMEADILLTKISNDQKETDEIHHKRIDFSLNLDFNKKKDFVADDIPNGTKVNFIGNSKQYTWQNGKVEEVKKHVKF